VLASLMDVPTPGRVLPCGRHLMLAMMAGTAWLVGASGVVSALTPTHRVDAVPSATHFAACTMLLVVAHFLSVAAHGDATGAPTPVRAVRIATWLAFTAVLVLPPLNAAIANLR
jgi:hypothetical protein